MAISVNWGTKVITVPKADTQLVSIGPPEVRQLDINIFRLELKALEDNEQGITYDDTHSHNPPVTIGGVTLARVVEIINGYTVTFENGSYAVNLVGANSNIADVTNLNNVQIRSANSAGLTFSEQINDQSFLNARVYINPTNGLPGTQFPRGTPTDPVDNFTDAESIAANRKFNQYDLFGTLNFGGTEDLTELQFTGRGFDKSTITLNGDITDNSIFENMSLSGTLNGITELEHVNILSAGLIDFNGNIEDSVLGGDITVDASCVGNLLQLLNCKSGVAGTGRPSFDLNGTTCDFSIRHYSGGITISGVTQNISGSIDFSSGTVEIDSSCTNGTIVVRGAADVIDNSGVGCTVIDKTVSSIGGSSDWTDPEKEQIRDALGVDGDKTTATGGFLQKLLTKGFWLGLK